MGQFPPSTIYHLLLQAHADHFLGDLDGVLSGAFPDVVAGAPQDEAVVAALVLADAADEHVVVLPMA